MRNFVLSQLLAIFVAASQNNNDGCSDYKDFDTSMPLRGSDWEMLCRKKKYEVMWDKLTEDTTIGPDTNIAIIDTDLDVLFTYQGDEIICGETCRVKASHSQGVVAKVAFKSSGKHPYTGLFKGADSGILRIGPRFTPDEFSGLNGWGSVAIKFFIDGMESADLLTQNYAVLGENTNLIRKLYSTTIYVDGSLVPPNQFCVYPSLETSNMASAYPIAQPTFQMADYDQKGNMEEDSNWPASLRLIPRDFDFPEDETDPLYWTNLTSIKKGTVLYDVHASDSVLPDVYDPEPIGRIELRSEFTTSFYGDTKLYFRHIRFEEAIARRVSDEIVAVEFDPPFQTPPVGVGIRAAIAGFPGTYCPFKVAYQTFGLDWSAGD